MPDSVIITRRVMTSRALRRHNYVVIYIHCGYVSYFFLPQGLYQGLEQGDDEGSLRNLQSLQERE